MYFKKNLRRSQNAGHTVQLRNTFLRLILTLQYSLYLISVKDLSHNVITAIDASGLYQLKQLKELNLTRCGLSSAQLGRHVFAWTGSIQTLILNENRFEEIPQLLR